MNDKSAKAAWWLLCWYTPVNYKDSSKECRYNLYMNTVTLIECDRILDGRKV